MSWEEYERGNELAAQGEQMARWAGNLLEVWGEENFRDLNRRVYKSTDCGAYVCLLLWADSPVWSGDQRLADIKPGDVKAIGVGSIVEGTDAAVEPDWLYLTDYLNLWEADYPEAESEDELDTKIATKLCDDFDKVVEAVEHAARDIWNETHGCDDCWKGHRVDESIDPDCESCGGDGVIR